MTESVEKVALRRALWSALRFAASRNAITANDEKAILAAFDAQAALSAIPAQGDVVATVHVRHGGYSMELATYVAYALPEGLNIPLVRQSALTAAQARIAELEALVKDAAAALRECRAELKAIRTVSAAITAWESNR